MNKKITKVIFVNAVPHGNSQYSSLPKHGDTKFLAIEEEDGYVSFPTLGLKVPTSNVSCVHFEPDVLAIDFHEEKKISAADRMAKARAAKKSNIDTDPGKIEPIRVALP